MRMRSWGVGVVLTACLVAALAAPAEAGLPKTMAFQGKLTDASGQPLNGDVSVTFRLYDAATAGAKLWEENQAVTVTNGLFSTLLGSVTPLTPAFDQPYWVEIQMGEEILSPRQPLAASPYALSAKRVEGVNVVSDPAGGGVGIGTTSPNSRASLHVAGTKTSAVLVENAKAYTALSTNNLPIGIFRVDATNTTQLGSFDPVGGSGGSGIVDLLATGVTVGRLTPAGLRIEPGGVSASPGSPLEVVKADGGVAFQLTNTASGDAAMALTNTVAGGDAALKLNTVGRSWNVAAKPTRFEVTDQTANKTRLSIDSNGQIGIGTTSPAALVNASIGPHDDLRYGNNPRLIIDTSGSQANALRLTVNEAATALEVNTPSGASFNVGPTGNFTVASPTATAAAPTQSSPSFTFNYSYWRGAASATNQGSIFGLMRQTSSPQGGLSFSAVGGNGNTQMFLQSDGNLGVGTANPAAKLDVNGPVRTAPGAAPSSPTAGTIYFDATTHHFYGYDGTAWKQLDN